MKEGWKMVKLGEVCEINLGKTPPRGEDRMWDKKMLTQNMWLSIADLKNTCNGYIYDSKEYISDVASELIPIVKEGTLMMSFKLSIGKCAIAGKDLRTNEAIAALPFKTDNVNIYYLKYYLEGFDWATFASGDEKVLGTTLNKKKLNIVPIILPSLSEQERIVSVLDSAFEKIEQSREKMQKLLDDAKELFQAQLKKEMTPKEGWEVKKIENICTIKGRIGYRGYTKNDLVDSPQKGAITLSPSNIIDNTMNYDNCSYVTWAKYEESPEIMINNGDILLVKTGSSYGKSAIVENLPHEATINPQFVVLKDFKVDNKFFAYFLRTEEMRKKFDEFVSGTAIPTFSQKNLGETIFEAPSLIEQTSIVSRLDVLSSQLKQIEEKTNKYLADLDELKQSLLKKAFEGKL